MKYKISTRICFTICLLTILFSGTLLFAQPEEIIINHSKSFKNNRQAPVTFPHGLHMEKFECLDCHHRYENNKNVLDEAELEEGNPAAQCSGCHNLKRTCDLQKTFHRQCLHCHVNNRKPGEKSGPRMCIGCHEKSGSSLHGLGSTLKKK
jgi:c(7)-type cytochrome triheme protein